MSVCGTAIQRKIEQMLLCQLKRNWEGEKQIKKTPMKKLRYSNNYVMMERKCV
jgi:hypothetical protein